MKERESTINEIISKSVEKELTRRIKIEQKALREELEKTVLLNNDLSAPDPSVKRKSGWLMPILKKEVSKTSLICSLHAEKLHST